MKKKIPFTKEIPFKTMIEEITDIEVEEDLEIKENIVEGDFIVNGKYKITEASAIEEEFSYNLPFYIDIDQKYVLDKATISISDFYFEIINENILKVNIEVEIENIYEKEEELIEELVREEPVIEEIPIVEENPPISIEVEEIEKVEETEEVQEPEEQIKEPSNITNIFNINGEETFATYKIYIVRENDTIETIINKYKTTKEDLEHYNDLNNITIETKVIIPCNNE